MTRNVKRFLAGSLLSLTPAIAFAAPVTEADFPNRLSERADYVSLRAAPVDVPVLKDAPTASIAPALQDHLVINQTGVTTYLGIQFLTGSLVGVYNPYPLPTATVGGFRVSAPAPTPAAPVIQQYYWTVDQANPGTTKTCLYEVHVTDVGGSCGAQVYFAPLNGATCGLDTVNSFINPTTCATQIVFGIQ